MRASDSGVKRAGLDWFPIKDRRSRKEKKTPKKGQSLAAYLVFFVSQSVGSNAFGD